MMPADDPHNGEDRMLIDVERATLLVVDIQDRLLPAVRDPDTLLARVDWLLRAAEAVGLPTVFTEQYPQGLGRTAAALRAAAPAAPVVEKRHFSCVAAATLPADVLAREQVVVCGMEAHVCVLQTALELKAAGKAVFVVADCIGSRAQSDYDIALRRFEQEGVRLVTREMVIYEALRVSGTEHFRRISREFLVQRLA